MGKFRFLILYLSRFDIPYLKELLVEVKLRGIIVLPVLDGISGMDYQVISGIDYRDSYLLTDCVNGIRFAIENDFGYSVLENDSLKTASYSSAECVILGLEEVDFGFVDRLYRRHFNYPWDIISTPRLLIREITAGDLNSLYEIYGDPSITEYMEDLYDNPDEELAYIKNHIKNVYGLYGYGMWVIIEKSTGRLIGRVGITPSEKYDEPELGYVIEKSKQRMGYGYEACLGVLDYARDALLLSGLNCFICFGNVKSISLCEKLNFTRLSEVYMNDRKMHRYHITF